jgi:hypothetical protein
MSGFTRWAWRRWRITFKGFACLGSRPRASAPEIFPPPSAGLKRTRRRTAGPSPAHKRAVFPAVTAARGRGYQTPVRASVIAAARARKAALRFITSRPPGTFSAAAPAVVPSCTL